MESKLPQVPQRWPQRPFRSLAAALLLAFLGVAAWPISPWRSGEKYVVAITALGEKSPDAASSEVWIAGAPGGVDLGALAASSTTPLGWEQRRQTLVSYRDQPATISFHGVLKPADQFLFGRHHWSGKVRVEINGQARDYDLHSPEPTTPLAVALSDFPAGKAARTRPNPAFLLWLAVWTVALTALLLAGPGLLRRLPPGPSEAPGLDGIRFALPSLIAFGFVLAGTWPAQMSPDSVDQWNQLHTGLLENGHPVVDTVLVGGAGALLGSIGWSMILQIVALAAAIGFLCRELSRWSINRALAWTAAVVTPLWPAVALLSTVFWKDIPYSIALCVLTALVLALIRTDGALAERRSYMAGLAATLFLAATFRHNGVIVTLGVALLLGIAYRRALRGRGIAVLLSAGVVLPLLWSLVLLPAAGVPGIGRQYGGMVPMHFLAAMAAEGQPLDEATTAKMEEILPLSQWKSRYDCLSVVPLFWAPGIHNDRLDGSLAGPALREALAHPATALRHFLCVNSLNWRLSPPDNAGYGFFPFAIFKFPTDPHPWDMTAQANETVRAMLDRVFQWTIATPWRVAIFWRPATTMLALLAFAAMAALQGMRPILLLPLAPVFLNVASLVPAIGSQDFRYEYPAVLIGPLLIAFYAGVCSLSTPAASPARPLDAREV